MLTPHEHVDALSWLESYCPAGVVWTKLVHFRDCWKSHQRWPSKGQRTQSLMPVHRQWTLAGLEETRSSRLKHQARSWHKIWSNLRHGRPCGCKPRQSPYLGPTNQTVFKKSSRPKPSMAGRMKPDYDEALSPVTVMTPHLSEHQAEGMLEGYVSIGRHTLRLRIIPSCCRFYDHSTLQILRKLTHTTWRKNYPVLNLIATSTVFQQDHNDTLNRCLDSLGWENLEYIREYSRQQIPIACLQWWTKPSRQKMWSIWSLLKHSRPQFYSADGWRIVREG